MCKTCVALSKKNEASYLIWAVLLSSFIQFAVNLTFLTDSLIVLFFNNQLNVFNDIERRKDVIDQRIYRVICIKYSKQRFISKKYFYF